MARRAGEWHGRGLVTSAASLARDERERAVAPETADAADTAETVESETAAAAVEPPLWSRRASHHGEPVIMAPDPPSKTNGAERQSGVA